MKSVHKYRGAVLLIALLTTVSGQIFAYPRVCAMPGMDMHGMAMTSDFTHMDGVESALSPVPEMVNGGEVNGSANCEQVCGYCLSFNFPHNERPMRVFEPLTSPWIDHRPIVTLSAPPDSHFRPPIVA